ncbi:hypothetical protein Pmar_PMAR015759 [Perkinsus marinus ATCC 50983]|uniref:Uncharacterized protein n=1 Tax=Perkinsus marinus (strain ATCC 50983 / TXsc) TaxID=423536 RepID=C5K8T1_PERM5|nr:hypothetical protein Pmar_PMAR015759 [Perkinsus marinus ATCC 50983]EER19105.1 hypothetical protein Pmar_PMAR015759 [Perkinsus marinus ATCC 50983]|eukprot:XP_002787309.1 hypothetical protein Pmar_PMAR015759 [Perkinsus marinus ATCC 50983]
MGVASNLVGVAFAAYFGHICYNFYSLSEIPLLEKPQQDAQFGVESFVPEGYRLDMDVYLSNQRGSAKGIPWTSMARVATFDNVTYDWRADSHRKDVKLSGAWLPDRFRARNESLYVHVVLRKAGSKGHRKGSNILGHRAMELSTYMVPHEERDGRHYLLQAFTNGTYAREIQKAPVPVARLSIPTKMEVGLIVETRTMDARKLYQKGLANLIDMNSRKIHLPIFMNTHATPRDEFEPVPLVGSTEPLPELTISFHKVGMGYWMVSQSLLHGFEHMEDVMKVNEYDLDSFKMLLSGSSGPWRLLVVYGVSFLHILFE